MIIICQEATVVMHSSPSPNSALAHSRPSETPGVTQICEGLACASILPVPQLRVENAGCGTSFDPQQKMAADKDTRKVKQAHDSLKWKGDAMETHRHAWALSQGPRHKDHQFSSGLRKSRTGTSKQRVQAVPAPPGCAHHRCRSAMATASGVRMWASSSGTFS